MYDLVVIGGGPAGATCARKAALNGLDVVLVDKQHHPRPKPCGGALGPLAITTLDFDVSHLAERSFNRARVHRPSKKMSTLTRDSLEGYLIQRSAFDSFLLKKAAEAGAEVVQGTEIVAIEQLKKGVRALSVGDSYKGHLLIGADGVDGLTAKKLGIRQRWSQENIAVCIQAEVPNDAQDERKDAALDIYYGLVEWGYGWCFPKRNSMNIGLGCRLDKARGLRDKWEQFLSILPEETTSELECTEKTSARVPLGGLPGRIIGRRTMLVGDAAGLVSPLSGEGISFAIESGKLAAEVATEVIQQKAPTHTVEYNLRMKKGLLAELKDLRAITQKLFKSEKNLETLFDVIDNDSTLNEYITGVFARVTPFSKLKYKIAKRLLTHHPIQAIRLGFL